MSGGGGRVIRESERLAEALERLDAMIEDTRSEKWDFSANDRADLKLIRAATSRAEGPAPDALKDELDKTIRNLRSVAKMWKAFAGNKIPDNAPNAYRNCSSDLNKCVDTLEQRFAALLAAAKTETGETARAEGPETPAPVNFIGEALADLRDAFTTTPFNNEQLLAISHLLADTWRTARNSVSQPRAEHAPAPQPDLWEIVDGSEADDWGITRKGEQGQTVAQMLWEKDAREIVAMHNRTAPPALGEKGEGNSAALDCGCVDKGDAIMGGAEPLAIEAASTEGGEIRAAMRQVNTALAERGTPAPTEEKL